MNYEKEAIDCALQHMKVFRDQALEEKAADFGEPCQNCYHAKDCNFDWLSKILPLLEQSNVKISMLAPPGMKEIQDIVHTGPA